MGTQPNGNLQRFLSLNSQKTKLIHYSIQAILVVSVSVCSSVNTALELWDWFLFCEPTWACSQETEGPSPQVKYVWSFIFHFYCSSFVLDYPNLKFTPIIITNFHTIFWWLVRVTLVIAFEFLPQFFGRLWGPRNDTLPFYKCRFSGGGGRGTMRWWGHSNPTLCKIICLNLFALTCGGDAKTSPGETFTNYFHLLAINVECLVQNINFLCHSEHDIVICSW